MGETNLIISDEGDFSTGTKDFDQLKMLTGNDTVRVEKKGIDTVVRTRKFNICMFTNSGSSCCTKM
jgi:phage/plasmid-associated DNA primase